jgi:hypothetical protein
MGKEEPMTSIVLHLFLLAPAAAPNDPDFQSQWSFHNAGQPVNGLPGTPGADIRAADAWDLHAGFRPVVVAVIGSGVDPHEQFADRLLPGHVPALAGGDPYSTLDVTGTGTRAAGIIAARRNDAIGIAGLHDGTLILPVRIASGASVHPAALADGITWAVDNDAEIALILVQLYEEDDAIADAVAYAAQQSVLVIAPAGHLGTGEVAFPGRLPECIAVAATTSYDTVADFSNFGPQVDLAAPGEWIWSTLGRDNYGYRDSGNTFLAAAHVAGVAALIRSYAPAVSSDEIREILEQSADDRGEPGVDDDFGNGRLNAHAALLATPRPLLHLEPLSPPPIRVRPLQAVSFPVRIANGAGTLNPTSPQIVYRTAPGPFTGSSSLTHLGGNTYSATIPPLACGTMLEYYLFAATLAGVAVTDPAQTPARLYTLTVDAEQAVYSDDFESDNGWTTTAAGAGTGAWVRGDPVGTFAAGNTPVQPEYDRSEDDGTACFFTGQGSPGAGPGANDVDGGPFLLTSPVIDITGRDHVQIRFAAWVYCDQGTPDSMLVELSTDAGNNWTPALSIPHNGQWENFVLNLDSFPALTGTSLRVRFTISDIPSDSLTEAAVDEFQVISQSCAAVQGDLDADGIVNLRDLGALEACLSGPAELRPGSCAIADLNNDLYVDLRDLAIFLRNARNE